MQWYTFLHHLPTFDYYGQECFRISLATVLSDHYLVNNSNHFAEEKKMVRSEFTNNLLDFHDLYLNFDVFFFFSIPVTEQLIRKKSEHNELMISTLEELSLHQEDIERIEQLQNWCRNLKILLLQNNLIGKIENIFKLKHLEYLNLAINNVEKIENLDELESLQKLDLTLNFIGALTSVDGLKNNYNLKHLTLTGNPCTDYDAYRDYVIVTLPQLETLDGIEIKRSDKILANQNFAEKRAKIVQLETEYCIRRDEQKIRINEQRELQLLENAQLNQEEIDEKLEKLHVSYGL